MAAAFETTAFEPTAYEMGGTPATATPSGVFCSAVIGLAIAIGASIASGSFRSHGMIVAPCSIKTMSNIACGNTGDLISRAADVMLKERRKLILVPRETPLSLVHVRNFELLLLAGAILLPANPSFYTRPQTITGVVDTVVARVLDHLGVAHNLVARWQAEEEKH